MRTKNREINLTEVAIEKQGENKNCFTDKNRGRVLEYYLTGDINGPEEYTEWFNQIRHASSIDLIKIYINSPGGDLYTTIQFMKVLDECQAFILASVEGACMSAATMILLHCDGFEVSPHSNFMFHNYSGAAFGKGGELKDQMTFESAWAESLMRSVYEDFLSSAEFESMMNGKDIWMNAQQVVDRLNKRHKIRQVKEAKKSSSEKPSKSSSRK